MRTSLMHLAVACALLVVVAAKDVVTSATLDNIELHLDHILADEELVSGYFSCLMDQGPCDLAGNALKAKLPDWFTTNCASCNEKQKARIDKVAQFAITKRPDIFQQLEKKYDPQGFYQARTSNTA